VLTQFQPYAELSGLSNLEGAGCGNSRSNLVSVKARSVTENMPAHMSRLALLLCRDGACPVSAGGILDAAGDAASRVSTGNWF